jgi:hypothetical protein
MRREKGQPRGIPHRRRWAGPPSGLLRSAPLRNASGRPSPAKTLPPEQNQPTTTTNSLETSPS